MKNARSSHLLTRLPQKAPYVSMTPAQKWLCSALTAHLYMCELPPREILSRHPVLAGRAELEPR